uniref:PHM7_ext domain-containing protein n=1 Tax=Macrostomum lignano TaxID=282301 RepID=A0A1I8FFU6_9PLAT
PTPRSSVWAFWGFLWTPDESVATLRLGFKRIVVKTAIQFFQSVYNQLKRSDDFGSSPQEALEKVKISAFIISNGSCHEVQSRVMLQNDSFIDRVPSKNSYPCADSCGSLRTSNSRTALPECTRDSTSRATSSSSLCCATTSLSLSSELVRYDYSRDMHYLKLDLVLQDEATRDAVRTQLADLSPPRSDSTSCGCGDC